MLAEPFGCARGRAIPQQIDNLAPLQADDDATYVRPFSPAPIVALVSKRR
jgi:hypothetical protein